MRVKSLFLYIVSLGMLFIFISNVCAADSFNYIVSNSEDWRDVYSVLHYANIKGISSDFLVSTKHGPLLLNGITKDNYLRVVSSKKMPYVFNFDSMIRGQGFKGADEVVTSNANLDLIEDLPDIDSFIIVGSTYGYNAIAVTPYAVISRSWVFFTDKINIDEIMSVLNNRKVSNVLVYGSVDREVRQALSKFNPEIINNEDRFEDNIDIFKKFDKLKPSKQVLLSNGEFIEKELMLGTQPILFTGKQNVPNQIGDFIKSSNIEIGVLVGADLVGAATNIRRTTGISVIVKFARGARAPAGSISAVEGLDLFYLPTPILDLGIYSARYNRASSQLEITYKSNSNIPLYIKGTITPNAGDKTKVGDVDPIFISPGDYKTVVYPDLKIIENNFSVEIFTLFGETPTSLEKILEGTINVDMVDILDRCEISIEGVSYNKPRASFYVKVKNIGKYDCYADSELKDLYIDGTQKTIGAEGSVVLKKGKTAKIQINQAMIEEDLLKNDYVTAIVYYGEKQEGLVKVIQGKFKLGIESISYLTIALIVVVIIVMIAIFFILFLLWKRRKNKEEDYF